MINSLQNLTGKIDIHYKGFAFVHVDDDKYYLDKDSISNACHGDIVVISPHHKRSNEKYRSAHVVNIIERSKDQFIGIYKNSNNHYAVPATHHIQSNIEIEDLNGNSPENNEYILVKIIKWHQNGQDATGKIIKVIGKENSPIFDSQMIINKFSIPDDFPDAVIKETKLLSEDININDQRLDLRKLNCFTIDPVDARDFDDAVSISYQDGIFSLGVHIADVSHYVGESSPLDSEALKRGTSVYFTDYVVHMLPEKLSTDLCSLIPHIDRLAMSIIMNISKDGETIDYDISPSIIHSKRRFTYQEAQSILNNKKGEYYKELSLLSNLAAILHKKRHDKGSIDLDIPELEYELDQQGIPISIKIKERLWSHQIIEECMLMANQEVAAYIRNKGKKLPFIYRIHEKPDYENVNEWFAFVEALGIRITNFGPPITPKKFQLVLDEALSQNNSPIIKNTALRTMMKAKYSVEPLGHFGLAFKDYTHFTSPIRRYPDLIVHRLLKYNLTNEDIPTSILHRLETIASISSDTELRAMYAEREYYRIKKLRFSKSHLGEIFNGIITDVSYKGLRISLSDVDIEGFISIYSLPEDQWNYDKRYMTIRGIRSRSTYKTGDKLNVRVVKIDPLLHRMDFDIVD